MFEFIMIPACNIQLSIVCMYCTITYIIYVQNSIDFSTIESFPKVSYKTQQEFF